MAQLRQRAEHAESARAAAFEAAAAAAASAGAAEEARSAAEARAAAAEGRAAATESELGKLKLVVMQQADAIGSLSAQLRELRKALQDGAAAQMDPAWRMRAGMAAAAVEEVVAVETVGSRRGRRR